MGRRHLAVVAAALGIYVLSFAAFYPNVVTVMDESAYLRQGAALAAGTTSVSQIDPYTNRPSVVAVSNYPPGTSALMAPLIAIGGWRAAFALGAVCMVGSVLLLAWWLREERRPVLFALLPLAYPPALIISRCAMSDLPSTLIVTEALVVFWLARGRAWWMGAAGLLAGLSWALRDTNPIVLAPFFAGTLLRRERGALVAAAAAVLGGLARPLESLAVYGELFHRNPGIFAFTASAPLQTLPVHLVGLMVFLPGGLLLAACHRGPRRVEVLSAIAAFFTIHLFYDYSASSSGGIKQLILAPRYFAPLVPLLAFALSESVPRLWKRYAGNVGQSIALADGWPAALLAIALVGPEVVGANWRHAAWSRGQRQIVDALYVKTSPARPVITNFTITRKYLNELYDRDFGPRMIADIAGVSDDRLARLLDMHHAVDVALLDRRDSKEWRAEADSDSVRVAHWRTLYDVRDVLATPELAGVGSVHVYSLTTRQ